MKRRENVSVNPLSCRVSKNTGVTCAPEEKPNPRHPLIIIIRADNMWNNICASRDDRRIKHEGRGGENDLFFTFYTRRGDSLLTFKAILFVYRTALCEMDDFLQNPRTILFF